MVVQPSLDSRGWAVDTWGAGVLLSFFGDVCWVGTVFCPPDVDCWGGGTDFCPPEFDCWGGVTVLFSFFFFFPPAALAYVRSWVGLSGSLFGLSFVPGWSKQVR